MSLKTAHMFMKNIADSFKAGFSGDRKYISSLLKFADLKEKRQE